MACKYLHTVTTYITNESVPNIVLQFPVKVTAVDKDKFCLKLSITLPSSVSNYPVLVTVNGTNIPVLNKYGNPLTAGTLRRCRVYKGFYGASTPHIIFNSVPLTCNAGCGNVL